MYIFQSEQANFDASVDNQFDCVYCKIMTMQYRSIRIRESQLEKIRQIGKESGLRTTEVVDFLLSLYDQRLQMQDDATEKRLKQIENTLMIYNTAISELLSKAKVPTNETT